MTSKAVPFYTFSGTGNTLFAARTLQEALQRRERPSVVQRIPLKTDRIPKLMPDLFGFASPVLGFSIPHFFKSFSASLSQGKGQQVFILLTAAGGDSPVNIAAHYQLQKKLEKKGYDVFYIRYLFMGSNWFQKFDDVVNKALSDVVKTKMEHMANDILNGTRRDPKPGFPIRALAAYAHWNEENIGARIFGKGLKAGKDCNQCFLCIKECPSGNIFLKKETVFFGWKCTWCMKCIYQCPKKAIHPRIFKASEVKGGYLHKDILELDRNLPVSPKGQKQLERLHDYLNDPAR